MANAKLADTAGLIADPRNPRMITDKAARGLGFSLAEFGDLSGIVFNLRTQQLVAGPLAPQWALWWVPKWARSWRLTPQPTSPWLSAALDHFHRR